MHQGFYRMIPCRMSVLRGLCSLCLAILLAGSVHAQESFGAKSEQPPNEDRYIYKQLPDIAIRTTHTPAIRLSSIWRDEPILLTMIFTRCGGICSPFLRSLKAAAVGVGRDYRVLVLSFDPHDTAADMDAMANDLGVKSDPGWIFGVASPSDIKRLAAASGFWFQWDPSIQQYDHPSVLVAVDRGKVVRMLAGANVPSASLREVAQELRGKFVASYALAGKVAFRCFEYDPNRGSYSLDWGVLLMLLPATGSLFATVWAFSFTSAKDKRL
jgi:protein SCO1